MNNSSGKVVVFERMLQPYFWHVQFTLMGSAIVCALTAWAVENARSPLLYIAFGLTQLTTLTAIVAVFLRISRKTVAGLGFVTAFVVLLSVATGFAALLNPLFGIEGRPVFLAFIALLELMLLVGAKCLAELIRTRRIRWAAKIGLVAALAVGLVQFVSHRESIFIDPGMSEAPPTRIVALGDSYISGEGATRYFEGTDDAESPCHQAPTAYPWLLAVKRSYAIDFLACSGARTFNVSDEARNSKPQYGSAGPERAGAVAQARRLKFLDDPEVVLISIGGNDAGFASLAQECIRHKCLDSGGAYLSNIENEVGPALEETYTEVAKNALLAVDPEADEFRRVGVFALTYPDPFGADCTVARMSKEEVAWIRHTFLPALNNAIVRAADRANVHVISLEQTLGGHGVCSKQPRSQQAINLLRVGHGRGSVVRYAASNVGALVTATFHPTEFGHTLMLEPVEKAVTEYLDGRKLNDPVAKRPQTGLALVEGSTDPGSEPEPFPLGTECEGDQLLRSDVVLVDANDASFELSGLARPSTVCYRREKEGWVSGPASAQGRFVVDMTAQTQEASRTEIIAQLPGGSWTSTVVVPTSPRVLIAPATEQAQAKEEIPAKPTSGERLLGAVVEGALALAFAGSLVMFLAMISWVWRREDLRW